MTDILSSFSEQIAGVVQSASASVVQLHGRRRQVAGVVFDTDLVLVPARVVDHATVAVRRTDGHVFEGVVVGYSPDTRVAVVRVSGLDLPSFRIGNEPKPGQLTIAVGRTWSGNIFTQLAPVSVVGGPLRTGRSSEIARVIRLGIPPHGALTGGALVDGSGALLGVVTGAELRGTTIVVPSDIAIAAAREVVAHEGERQGFIGITSLPVSLAPRQRADGRERGVLVTGLTRGGPAESAGILVGDILVALDGKPIAGHEDVLLGLRGARIGQPASISMIRGDKLEAITVTIEERTHEQV